MTKTLEEMKMVSGGTFMNGLAKLAGGDIINRFFEGDRVIEEVTGWHGTVALVVHDYRLDEYFYRIDCDNGHVLHGIPDRFLRAE